MADSDGVIFVIEEGGETYMRVYRRSDTKDGMIIIGRLSSTTPGEPVPQDDPLGGLIVAKGLAAFVCPVMSRQHARLVFGSEGQVYLSDPPDHSHHGTYITRGPEAFKVGHPQLLQTGDKITFGKPVHRGGEVYEPLSVKVELLSHHSPTTSPTTSFTGKGYALPANIDNEFSNDDDIEEIEHQDTHKHYAVEEISSDEDDDDSKSFDIPVMCDPPLLQPQPQRTCGFPLLDTPAWAVPKPVWPSQIIMQSRQPCSPLFGSFSNSLSQSLTLPPPWRLPYSNEDLGAPPTLSPILQLERERNRAVALSVLDTIQEVVGVGAHEPEIEELFQREVIDVDAFPTPEPERPLPELSPEPVSQDAPAESSDMSTSDSDESRSDSQESEDADQDMEQEVDIVAVDDAPPPMLPVDTRPERPAQEEFAPIERPPAPIKPADDTDALSDAAEQYEEFRIINQSIKQLKDKVELLQGSRNRSKRRFHLFKADVEARLAKLQEKYDALTEEQKQLVVKGEGFAREMEQRKEALDNMAFEKGKTMDEQLKIVLRDVKEVRESMETRKTEIMEEVQKIVNEADDALKAKMETLNTAVESTATLMTETRDALKSRKRKRDEREDETLLPLQSGPIVGPVQRPMKRRRFPRVVAPVLGAAVIYYLWLGVV